MSTLKVTNIKKTGETAGRDVSGVAAAWVNFNGIGTVAIRDSVNVSSITDNETGVYSVNFTAAYTGQSYIMSGSIGSDSAGNSTFRGLSQDFTFGSVNAVRVLSAYVTASNNRTSTDDEAVSVVTHGDLA